MLTKPQAQPALTRRRPITAGELSQMMDLGIFGSEKIELIGGEIIQHMAPQKNPHAFTLSAGVSQLFKIFPEEKFWVRNQMSLQIDNLSVPDPDIVVLAYPMNSNGVFPSAADTLLVAEVSETTLYVDRKRKMSLYAAGGISDYLILNVLAKQAEVHRDPVPDPSADFGFRYASITILKPGDVFTPLAAPHSKIEVARHF